MNNRFAVKMKEDSLGVSLSITKNGGDSWISILINDPEKEIPLIIDVLRKHISNKDDIKCPNCITGKMSTLYLCTKCGYETPLPPVLPV